MVQLLRTPPLGLSFRFNTVDGEDYGRSRVEEYIGDLRALESLSQALVEGSAAAAKVVFVVSPSSTTKPQTLAQAGNGAIVQGRPDDIGVVQVGKTADFATASQMAQNLERRIGDGFLQLNIRQSERTTAEEVRLTQLELEQQLGGIFSLLTVEFLVPYLNRTMMVLQRNREIPKIPKGLVNPSIVAGVNALGRGQDRESLTQFITTIAQTMGPEALVKYVDPSEYIKRLAAAQGIDMLNLVKDEQMLQQRNGTATSCCSTAVSRGTSWTTGWFSLSRSIQKPCIRRSIKWRRRKSKLTVEEGKKKARFGRKRKP